MDSAKTMLEPFYKGIFSIFAGNRQICLLTCVKKCFLDQNVTYLIWNCGNVKGNLSKPICQALKRYATTKQMPMAIIKLWFVL